MALAALRTQTHALHQELEAQMDLLRPDLTRERYAALIQRTHALYRTLEGQLGVMLPAEWQRRLDWDSRRKVGLLQQDLNHLGQCPHPDLLDALDISSEGAAWGVLYVLEGATLGGQVICRQLGPRLNLSARAGLRFYASYGELVGPRWKVFCALLTERAAHDLAPEAFTAAAALAAQQTFRAFGRWVVPALGPPRVTLTPVTVELVPA
jgi:heme oxygenase (biliverdin-IX-beta and delta-forming)